MKFLRVMLAALLLGAVVGCSRPAQPAAVKTTASQRLRGTWYESRTGAEYQFATDSLLIVPHAQAGGGNAVTYALLGDRRLDVQTAGTHRVSDIVTITAEALVLADPVSGYRQRFVRDPGKTEFMKSAEVGARLAASQISTITIMPDIVWVAPKPTGKGSEWTTWSSMTFSAYTQAWDWSALKRDASFAKVAGAGDGAAYTFSFARKLPTAEKLRKYNADNSVEATAGLAHIDVGYSASKATYPAGTFVYLPGGMIFSLGNGYAIGIGMDPKSQSFVPVTHN